MLFTPAPHISSRTTLTLLAAILALALLPFALTAGADTASAQTPCSNGIAVPDPDSNPGLVQDCANLLIARDPLRGDATLNWSADTSIYDWDGITIDDASQRVSGLSLHERELSGTLPSELSDLTNLERLELPDNQLRGTIPSDLSNLSNLRTLWLSRNQLTGMIPLELGSLSNLQWLVMSGNQLTGTIPLELGRLSNLRGLYLSGNQLEGTIPLELGNLSNLEELVLQESQLTGEIPPELGDLTNLERLSLHNNQLTGAIPPELGKLTNLSGLQLYRNQLTGAIPPELGNLSNLYELVLHVNLLEGSIPPELGNLANLRALFVNDNQLTGEIPPELGDLTKLERLNLSNNQLTGAIPPELGNLTNLTELRLHNNQLTGAIPSELGNLSNLTGLWLDSNQLTGELPQSLTALTSLERFNISNNAGLCAPLDEDFQAWLQAIPEHYGPECLPDLPPAEVIQDPVISYLKWYIGEGIKQEELQSAMESSHLLRQYAAERGLPETDEEIIVYFYHDLEQIAVAYAKETGRSLDESRAHWEGDGFDGEAGRGWIFLKVSPPGESFGEPDGLMGIMAHELVHAAYQLRLTGSFTDPAAFEGRSVATPRWLTEGMASLLPEIVLAEYRGIPYSQARVPHVSRAADIDIPLRDAETWPTDRRERVGPEEERAIIDCIYKCGYVAVELLASHVGLSKLPYYYMYLESSMVPEGYDDELPRPGWRIAFERAFGMTVEEFYALFEEHRAAGFPEVDLPIAPPTDVCTTLLNSDVTITGSWDSDCLSESRPDDGDYYTRFYQITLDTATDVTITLTSEHDTYLYLFEGEASGAALHENDDHGAEGDCTADLGLGTDSCIVATLDAGSYTIEATTYDPDVTGEFTLTVNGIDAGVTPPPPTLTDDCVTLLNSDVTITGSWDSDCLSVSRPDDGDYYARFYQIILDAATDVTITLTSERDAYLYLFEGEASGEALHENDDYEGLPALASDTDSRIIASLGAGDYTIEVTTFDPEVTGEFTIMIEGLGQGTEPPEPPEPPPSSGSYTTLVIGELHTCGLRTDGFVVCWGGDDISGQVLDTPTGDRFTTIAAGPHHTCGIRTDGSVACWGNDDDGLVSNTPTSGTFTAIFVGKYHNCGIRTDDSAVCWGRNDYNQSTPP